MSQLRKIKPFLQFKKAKDNLGLQEEFYLDLYQNIWYDILKICLFVELT